MKKTVFLKDSQVQAAKDQDISESHVSTYL